MKKILTFSLLFGVLSAEAYEHAWKNQVCSITCADGTTKVMQRDPSNHQPVQSDGHCYSLGMNACESHGGLKGVEYGIKKAQGKEKKQ